MMRIKRVAALSAGAAALALAASAGWAKSGPGVTKDSVLVCAYEPMTGSESSYFRQGKGADAWFKYVNAHGGVDGRKIIYKMVDDGYEPARTRVIVKRFVEKDHCFAIVAALGSAPTAAVIDYIASKDVPLVGPGTGAEKNVEYPSKWIFPLYPPYKEEGAELVRFAAEALHAKTAAYLYQNDPSGKSELEGITPAAEKYGVKMVSVQPYEVQNIDVSAQTVAMKNANPDVVLCACAPEPAAKFLTQRKQLGWNVPVINVFFGKSPKVPELAGDAAVEGVYFTTIFRDFDSPAPQIQLAKQILHEYYPNETPDPIHLWGFAGAQLFTEALKKMGNNITRPRLVSTLESIKHWDGSVVPDVTIEHGNAPQHFIVRLMSFVQFKNGKFQEIKAPWEK